MWEYRNEHFQSGTNFFNRKKIILVLTVNNAGDNCRITQYIVRFGIKKQVFKEDFKDFKDAYDKYDELFEKLMKE